MWFAVEAWFGVVDGAVVEEPFGHFIALSDVCGGVKGAGVGHGSVALEEIGEIEVCANDDVIEEADAVRTFLRNEARVGVQKRLKNGLIAAHGIEKRVGTGSGVDEGLSDFELSHVRGAAEGSFKISFAPVPGRVGDARIFYQVVLDCIYISVSVLNELVYGFAGYGHFGA